MLDHRMTEKMTSHRVEWKRRAHKGEDITKYIGSTMVMVQMENQNFMMRNAQLWDTNNVKKRNSILKDRRNLQ